MVRQDFILNYLQDHPNSSTIEIAMVLKDEDQYKNYAWHTLRANVSQKCHTLHRQGFLKKVNKDRIAYWSLTDHPKTEWGCAA